MWDWLLVLAVSVSILSILLRFVPLLKSDWVGVDTFYHLTISEDMCNGTRVAPGDVHFVHRAGYSHPPLYHVLLSKFGRSWHKRLQLIGPVSDLASGVFVGFASYATFGFESSLLILALYLTFPILIDSSWTLGTRSFANLLFVALISLSFLDVEGVLSMPAFALEVLLAVLVLMTHRLYTQILVAVAIADVLVRGLDDIALATIIGVSLLSLTRTYRRVLKGHIQFLRNFANILRDRTMRIYVSGKYPHPLVFAANAPAALLFPALVLVSRIPLDGDGRLYLGLSVGVLIFSLLWPFGQGYRHLVGMAVPCAFGFVYVEDWSGGAKAAIAVILIIQVAIQIVKTHRVLSPKRRFLVPDDLIECLSYLSRGSMSKAGSNVLILPLDYSYAGLYFSQFTILEGSGGEGSGWLFNTMLRTRLDQGDLARVADDFQLWAIVAVKDELSNLPPAGFREEYRSGGFVCLVREPP